MFRNKLRFFHGFDRLKGGFDQGDAKNEKELSGPGLAPLYQLPLILTIQFKVLLHFNCSYIANPFVHCLSLGMLESADADLLDVRSKS